MRPNWPAPSATMAATESQPGESLSSPLGELSGERFLHDYWQQRPCVIRAALPDWDCPLDEHDLAALALQPEVRSRLISGHQERGDWRQHHGPFEIGTLEGLPDRDWTLLVQDLEQHLPQLNELLDRFNFIPRWRLGDLMASFAAPGGSVGPHVDQYDVFLLQVAGRRRWSIAGHFDPTLLPDLEFSVLKGFHPESEYELGPGDMLYLPPGVAHHGEALDACLTFSIGFRAPDGAEILAELAEDRLQRPAGPRFRDPAGREGQPGELTSSDLQRLSHLLSETLPRGHTATAHFFGQLLSRPGCDWDGGAEQDDTAQPEIALGTLESWVTTGELQHHPVNRWTWVDMGGHAQLFGAGQSLSCRKDFAIWLCASALLPPPPRPLDAEEWQWLLEWTREGRLRHRLDLKKE